MASSYSSSEDDNDELGLMNCNTDSEPNIIQSLGDCSVVEPYQFEPVNTKNFFYKKKLKCAKFAAHQNFGVRALQWCSFRGGSRSLV